MRMFYKCLIGSLSLLVLLGCRSTETVPVEAEATKPVPAYEAVTDAPHVHAWTEATCTEPKTCSLCGAIEGEPEGHDFTEATCTEPKTCSRCGASEGEPKEHDLSGVTCTEAGVCPRCGKTTEPLGHDWVEATCTLPKTCRRCGLTEGEAPGHRMEDGVCTQCGYTVFQPFRGTGDAVLNDVQTGNGIYRVHITLSDESDLTVWAYDANGKADLIVCKRDRYDGSALLFGEAPFTFDIFSRAPWELAIEQLDLTTDTAFSGAKDYVTDLCPLTSGVYRFTHCGRDDFTVWVYTTDGETLLVQERSGPCTIEQTINVPEGSFAFFVVRTNAAWTIERIGDPE